MKYTKLLPFKLGEITADGWIHEQLRRNKDGIGGHLDELEPLMIRTPYTERRTEGNWGGAGWGAEISGNYWYGLIVLAFSLQDDELIKKATDWVEAVLANREEDGYMGAYSKDDNRMEDYNAWGTACGMRAMLAFYDATGREDVFDAVYKCMLWFCENWKDHKTSYAGHAITEPMLECYARTGDERLLKFSLDYDDFMEKDNSYLTSTSFMSSDGWQYNSDHTVAYGICLRRVLALYGATGDEKYLHAAKKGLEKLRRYSMQITGAPISDDEWLSPVSMQNESETCNFAVYNYDYAMYEQLTGDPVYGGYREQIVFNAAEGARKKDEKAIAYMTMPNQFEASEIASRSHIWATMYAPCVPTSCCPVYSVHILPDYLRFMAMLDENGDLYINSYGPCHISSADYDISIETMYPFSGKVNIKINRAPSVKKKITFRIPEWSLETKLTFMGENISGDSITRMWKPGDEITLEFGMRPDIVQIDDSDAGNKQPFAVVCGPLVYSIPLAEKWNPVGNGHARTPLPEGWTWYNVVSPDLSLRDAAIDPDIASATAELIQGGTGGYVWEDPPVRVRLDLYKAPYLYCRYARLAKEPAGRLQYVTDRFTTELVPYGCTALRVTYIAEADVKRKS